VTAKLYALPPGLWDIPTLLRNIADELEAGKYGEVTEGALVLNGDALELFGLGKADSTVTHYLFCCGARKMEAPCVDR
jgi:hypothetical protein